MFSQIHDICFWGQGGYDWNTVYDMPIWLRMFTFNKIKEYHDKQNEELEKQQSLLNNKDGNKFEISKPNITSKPDYITKASRK